MLTAETYKIKWSNVVIGILLILTGIYVLAVRVGEGTLNGLASSSWPTVPGTITKSQVLVTEKKGTDSHTAMVEYSYAVNGKSYGGNTVFFGCCGGGSGKEESAISQRYPLNNPVNVHFKPDHPSVSVLEPGLHLEKMAMFLLIGIFVTIAGCGFLLKSREKVL
jgi:hypothetical protein